MQWTKTLFDQWGALNQPIDDEDFVDKMLSRFRPTYNLFIIRDIESRLTVVSFNDLCYLLLTEETQLAKDFVQVEVITLSAQYTSRQSNTKGRGCGWGRQTSYGQVYGSFFSSRSFSNSNSPNHFLGGTNNQFSN